MRCPKLFKRAATDWELDDPQAIKLSRTIQIIRSHCDYFFCEVTREYVETVALNMGRDAARINYRVEKREICV